MKAEGIGIHSTTAILCVVGLLAGCDPPRLIDGVAEVEQVVQSLDSDAPKVLAEAAEVGEPKGPAQPKVLGEVKKSRVKPSLPTEWEVSALVTADFIPKDTQLLDVHGATVSRERLKGKYLGIYFSAHWCGPCRYFTPKLQAFRDANKENFEVVFISLDLDRKNRNPAGHLAKKKEYMESAKMDWYTIHRNYGSAHALLNTTGKRGIPTLVVFSPEGKYITNDGKNDLKKNPQTALESWEKLAKGDVQ